RAFGALLLLGVLGSATAGSAQPVSSPDVAPALQPAVTAYRAGDRATAETALRSLSSGNPDAAAWLGAVLLDRGSDREALRLIQQAAQAGSAEGAHRLGLAYALGLGGMPRDDARAAALFERAASAGH